MNWIFIEPADVWLFRDGKSFDAGADHRARSFFPPTPFTMQGAIRSRYLVQKGVDLADYGQGDQPGAQPLTQRVGKEIGWPRDAGYGQLQLRGPFVAHWPASANAPTVYFPLPADVVKLKGQDDYRLLTPLADDPFRSNWPESELKLLWLREDGILEDVPDRWVDGPTLCRCLDNQAPAASEVHHSDVLFARESRFEVGIDSRRKRPEEGLLYQVEFIRPRERVGLLVGVEGITLDAPGLLILGGEARASRYRESPAPSLPGTAISAPDSNGLVRFKVYCATPAWFTDGWRAADWGQWFQGPGLRPVAAAVGRAAPIGGALVDTRSQQRGAFQKGMRRYVPAGSVFYFQADGPVAFTSIAGSAIGDDATNAQIGFGQIFIGRW